ncbi:unnamed protein product, partial [Brenthis ino]
MRSTAGGRWRRSWELGVESSSHGRVIHHAAPAPLNGDATHTTATRRANTARECVSCSRLACAYARALRVRDARVCVCVCVCAYGLRFQHLLN